MLEEKVLKLIEQEDDDEDVQALLQTTGPTRDLPASKILINFSKLYCMCSFLMSLPIINRACHVDHVTVLSVAIIYSDHSYHLHNVEAFKIQATNYNYCLSLPSKPYRTGHLSRLHGLVISNP